MPAIQDPPSHNPTTTTPRRSLPLATTRSAIAFLLGAASILCSLTPLMLLGIAFARSRASDEVAILQIPVRSFPALVGSPTLALLLILSPLGWGVAFGTLGAMLANAPRKHAAKTTLAAAAWRIATFGWVIGLLSALALTIYASLVSSGKIWIL